MMGSRKRLDDFRPLWPAEEKLVIWLQAGHRTVCEISANCPPENAAREARIRASFLRYLILGGCGRCGVPETGLQIRGAYVEGDGAEGAETRGLDLEGCAIASDIVLFACRFPDLLLLRSARTASLYLNQSTLSCGLSADRLETRGGVFLRDLVAQGEVRLLGAKLGGELACTGAQLTGGTDKDGNVGHALLADRLETRAGVFLRDLVAQGEVRLLGAKLGGLLDCSDARLTGGTDKDGNVGHALSADGLEARGVSLQGLVTQGMVRLPGAKLGNNLECNDARLTGGTDKDVCVGYALSADGLETRGGVFLHDLVAQGEVRLLGAKLGGELACNGARLTGGTDKDGNVGHALSADGLEARGGVFLRGLEAQGEVRLPGAKLGGPLDCSDARLTGGTDKDGNVGDALSVDGLETRADIILRGLEVQGMVRLPGARLGGDLVCVGASLNAVRSTDSTSRTALSLNRARIDGAFFLRDSTTIHGVLDLTDAEIGTLCDHSDCWPPRIALVGCRYRAIIGSGAPVDAGSRLNWLDRMQPAAYGQEFWPQPYDQCARVLREMGHGRDARKILVEKEKRHRAARRAQVAKAYGFPFGQAYAGWLYLVDKMLGATISYGRRPMLAFLWLAGFLALGTAAFAYANAHDALKPNLPQIQRAPEWVRCAATEGEGVLLAGLTKPVPGLRRQEESRYDCFRRQPEGQSYPSFNAFMYSLDTLLPVVAVEMQSYWIPDDRVSIGRCVRIYLWVHILFGWALALLAVAGFSGLVKTDHSK